jgi:hypothetical protein
MKPPLTINKLHRLLKGYGLSRNRVEWNEAGTATVQSGGYVAGPFAAGVFEVEYRMGDFVSGMDLQTLARIMGWLRRDGYFVATAAGGLWIYVSHDEHLLRRETGRLTMQSGPHASEGA